MQLVLLLLFQLGLLAVQAVPKQVPHVSECNFCTTCFDGRQPALDTPTTEDAAPNRRALRHVQAVQLPSAVARGLWASAHGLPPAELKADMFLATSADTVPKQTLPNCTECYGCNTQLLPMDSESTFFNTTYINEKGATSNWLFKATNPSTGDPAVIKVYCVPIPKVASGRVPLCSPSLVLGKMKLFIAIEKLSEECGFQDMIPKAWIDKVDAVMPDVGYHIRWHGLWMELVRGVSLESFLHKGKPTRLPPKAVLDVMHTRLNTSQVVRAAIFDLLTSQCDRHAQNVFIDEQGQLTLIDNEACLQHEWKTCGFDSIFVPTSQKQEIIRLSNQFVLKYVTPEEAPQGVADPLLLLDYRCYLDNGAEELGTNYPPQVKQCLANIKGMTVQQVQEHYGLDELPARNLHTRATDMLDKGFEWAFKYGEPRNANPKRYLVQPKCCRVQWVGMYRCAHEYNAKFELPFGDPITGRDWTKPKHDIGTFEGGTRFD